MTLELFWKGARDYRAGGDKGEREERLVASCRRQFRRLREKVEAFDGFRRLEGRNYDVSSEEHGTRLLNNLLNTEVDIVLESPGRLYIGEAKCQSGFHADGNHVLVHQLVRQYVMARVLVDVAGGGREVVPFVVTRECPRFDQVRFMIERGWMEAGNCLTWEEVAALASEGAGTVRAARPAHEGGSSRPRRSVVARARNSGETGM